MNNLKVKMKEKMNNKGFSLVELIIVIAIMAVLIAVLAPQFLRYVERSRLQADNTALGEIANAVKVAASEEAIYNEIGTAGVTLTFVHAPTAAANVGGAGTLLAPHLNTTLGVVRLTSNSYTTLPTITAAVQADGSVLIQTAGYVNNVGDTPAPKIF